jgi:glycosidase
VRAVRSQNGATLANQIQNYHKLITDRSPDAINALFLSNHDNDRSAVFFRDDETAKKLAAALYMLIPGNSFIYYGEEIGLTGRGIDENKRAPIIWSMTDPTGQTQGPAAMNERPQMDEGVAEQLAREGSLLNYYRNIIQVKNSHPAIARGIPTAVDAGVKELCCYTVSYRDERLLVAHNLSGEPVTATLPLDGVSLTISASLSASADAIDSGAFNIDGTQLSLPGFGTAIIELTALQR